MSDDNVSAPDEFLTYKDTHSETKEEEVKTEVDATLSAGEQKNKISQKFGTFQGVFRPTILTILGVMMYLREGWVVGNAGLGGAILIILICYSITGTTALSISAITSNIRLGAGGVFSIISQSLGLEMGGAIGIPFYIAQGLSTAMYIYGFMEGWLIIFPNHPTYLIISGVFIVIFLLSVISTTLAFRVQVIVMVGILLALASLAMGLEVAETLHRPQFWGGFEDASFWMLFAVYFPSATGIMVGASMSGNLKNARKSIPLGTMAAWAGSLMIYLAMAVWYSLIASPEDLRGFNDISVTRSKYEYLVLIGILSSCFTAALSSFVAAPRILQALGSHKIVPMHDFFKILHNGEPRNASIFTGTIVVVVLVLGDLNAIAEVLTMFFLVTYFTINFVLALEQRLNLISFRPAVNIPILVPFLGAISCLSAMMVISALWGIMAIAICIGIYYYLDRRNLEDPFETVRSGLFGSVANWAAKKVAMSSEKNTPRSWKPDLLVPIERRTQLNGNFRLLVALVHPQGSIQVIGLLKDHDIMPLLGTKQVIRDLQEEGVFASSAIIHSSNFVNSLDTSIAVMKGSIFQPNTIFTHLEGRDRQEIQDIVNMSRQNKVGVIFFENHPEVGLGRERVINLWVRDQTPNWHLGLNMANIDLQMLIGYKLMQNWGAKIRLLSVVKTEEDKAIAEKYLLDLMNVARMDKNFQIHVEVGDFNEFIQRVPKADLNIFGLGDEVNKLFLQQLVINTKSSCMFIRDSGLESALA